MTIWLDNALISGPHFCLATSDEEYQEACAWLDIPQATRGVWLDVAGGEDACVHIMQTVKNTCIVCLSVLESDSGITIAGRLVHEAVHVWQSYKQYICEHTPSMEFEAYSIQKIAVELMQAYTNKEMK